MKFIHSLLLACLLLPIVLFSQSERNLLTDRFSQHQLSDWIVPGALSAQYPVYSNRTEWNKLDAADRQQLITAGEAYLDYSWPIIPAGTYLEFVRSGNRKVMEDLFNANHAALRALVLAELAEGKQRFLPAMINGVWSICEWSTWSISASIGLQKAGAGLPDIEEPIVELGTGIIANTMAWTYYLFKETFNATSPLIAKRMELEIQRRILIPYYERTDFWWMALDGKKRMVNNWNVWLNYNALTCMLLVEKDTAKRSAGIYKTMRSVDQFINYYKDDGGCEEGPAYWSHAGGMLYNYLSMLETSTSGIINLFEEPLVKNIGTYISKAFIDSSYFLNYADASARLTADAGLIYLYGKAIQNDTMQSFGSYLATQQQWNKNIPVTSTVYGTIRNLLLSKELSQVNPAAPYFATAWLPQTGIAIARDAAGSSSGFYFSALAGHNDESHNHNDVGTCVVYYDGKPVLIDIGNETYTRQTFSSERYTIWTMRSAFHNVPLINGIEQKEGATYAAKNVQYHSNSKEASFRVNIEGAYPSTAGVKSWQRSYRLNRNKSFEIADRFGLDHNNGKTALHFMTSADVMMKKPGVLVLKTGENNIDLEYDHKLWEPVIETITVTDKLLLQSWPTELHRIILKLRTTNKKVQSSIVLKKST